MTPEKSTIAAVDMWVLWDVPIPMEDQVNLRCNVYLPSAEGSYPVVMAMTDYGKDLPFSQGYSGAWKVVVDAVPDAVADTSSCYISFEAPDPEKWVVHGYAVVIVDSRGLGRSEGKVNSLSGREADDYALAVDWVGEQSWCTGNVGTLGMSYLGAMQWLCASRKPKHLKGIIPWMAFDSQLRQLSYNGGIPSTFFRSWTSASIRSVQNGLGTRGYRNEFTGKLVSGDVDFPQQELDANITDIYEQVMQHPLDDGFYDDRTAAWENIEVPFLSFSAWAAVGVHLRGNVEGFVNAASSKKWLSIRQEHGVFSALYSKEGVELQRRFFDYVLKDIKEFAEQQPKVELVIRDTNDQKIGMRSETEWPLACTEWTKLYLDADTTALLGVAPDSSSSATYRAFSKGITFLTKPFSDKVEITGPLAAKLWVSSSTTDADIFVAVRVFDQDGKEKLFHGLPDPRMPFSQGWLRASQRELDPDRSLPYRPFLSHNTVKPLWPGKAYEVDIEIWPTCAVIPAGYRLGLSILGQDFEHDEQPIEYGKFGQMMRGSGTWLHVDPLYRPPAVFDNEITLHSGPDQHAYLLLPVITKPLDEVP